MILLFSGTGNSRYVAQLISKITGDTIVSMNDLIKEGRLEDLQSERPYVIVCPIYAWKIPRVVETLIKQVNFAGNKRVYTIVTCGDDSGNAAKHMKKLLQEKGLKSAGFQTVVMPENYVAMYPVPDKKQSAAIISKAVPQIKQIAQMIQNGRDLPEEKSSFGDGIKSGIVNSAFYTFFVKASGFHTEDTCTSCGKCVKLCPLNNIKLEDKKPSWGSSCTHCMACICGCPVEAIEYKKKTKGKPRYYNKELPR